MIPGEDGQRFLSLARKSVETYLKNAEPQDDALSSRYQVPQGVFVTIHQAGSLRGCIGFPEPVLPLYQAVISAARAAAFEDPRFPPVSKEELASLTFEVSVLTIPKDLKQGSSASMVRAIRVGTDGLIIKGRRSGLLLPQVATEHGLDAKAFLECVCHKAGLEADAWKDPQNRLYTFQAQVFSE